MFAVGGFGSVLAGIRVLDLTRNLAGPYCTSILGDLGADVVKIERPGEGDDTRAWAPPHWGTESATFLAANPSKRSIAVDLDVAAGLEIVKRLVARADVLVESFKPGSLARRGLGYDDLKARHPGLVYCSISAFGQQGPMREAQGYDPVLQAYTGIMSLTGQADGPPARIGIGAVDLGASLWATIGILCAIDQRKTTGAGCRVDTSLFEASTWWLSYHMAGFMASGVVPLRSGTQATFIAPYEVFPTRDEGLFIGAANDNLYRSLMEALGLSELGSDARFATNPIRVQNRAELNAIIVAKLKERSAAEWEKEFRDRSIPCSRVRTVADLVADDHLEASGMLVPVAHPTVSDLRLLDLPVTRNGARTEHPLPPPLLGEHTDAVLAELGYSQAEVLELRRSGAVG